MNRRSTLKLLPLGLLSGCSASTPNTPQNNQLENCQIFEDFISAENEEGIGFLGAGSSRHEEVREAFRLLWDSPRTSNHMQIARYFEGIKSINTNERDAAGNYPRYNEEWVTVSNPLITSFFGMTNTLPAKGDVVPWCSAFVSFVIYAAGKIPKFSAASKAYRKYSTETNSPNYGDLAVFENRKNTNLGHVGFFVERKDAGIMVLGGNQRGNTGSTGAITTSLYKHDHPVLKLHSFRSMT